MKQWLCQLGVVGLFLIVIWDGDKSRRAASDA